MNKWEIGSNLFLKLKNKLFHISLEILVSKDCTFDDILFVKQAVSTVIIFFFLLTWNFYNQ